MRYLALRPTPQPPPCREGEQDSERGGALILPEANSPSLQGGGWGVGREASNTFCTTARALGPPTRTMARGAGPPADDTATMVSSGCGADVEVSVMRTQQAR